MAEAGSLEVLQTLCRELTTVAEALKEDREVLGLELLTELSINCQLLLERTGDTFKKLLEKPGRRKESRDAVLSGLFLSYFAQCVLFIILTIYLPIGKVGILNDEYSLNKDFQELVLQVADELDLDEIEAAKLAVLAADDETTLGRSQKECAIIRFHTQRIYMLKCMVLLLELSKEEDELLSEGVSDELGNLGLYVNETIFRQSLPGTANPPSQPRFVSACMAAMHDIRMWLQKLSEQVASAAVLGRASEAHFQETVEFTYLSLVQQHEFLSVILCYAIDRHVAVEEDFLDFLRVLKQATRYDPPLGEFRERPPGIKTTNGKNVL